jgi:hypothetical protein
LDTRPIPGPAAQKAHHLNQQEPSLRASAHARGVLHPGAPQHTPQRRADYPTLLLWKELNDAGHGGRDSRAAQAETINADLLTFVQS